MTGAALARGAAMRFVAVAALLASCTSPPGDADDDLGFDEDDGFSDDGGKADSAAWTSIGRGVAYQQVNAGPAIVIAYGGYTAKLGYSAAWARELVDARLGAEDVGHIYAVQGPADPGYAAREIANTKLRAHLAGIDDGASP
ncbi:MAG: hypothetical protein ABI867_45140, partial [Kofleriaceae bacterium]